MPQEYHPRGACASATWAKRGGGGGGLGGSTSRSWSPAEHLGYCPSSPLTQEGHQMAPNHSKSHHILEPGFLLLPLCAPSYLPSPLPPTDPRASLRYLVFTLHSWRANCRAHTSSFPALATIMDPLAPPLSTPPSLHPSIPPSIQPLKPVLSPKRSCYD